MDLQIRRRRGCPASQPEQENAAAPPHAHPHPHPPTFWRSWLRKSTVQSWRDALPASLRSAWLISLACRPMVACTRGLEGGGELSAETGVGSRLD